MSSPQPTQAISRFVLVLFQSGYPRDRLGDISYFVMRTIQGELDDRIDTDPKTTEIDVWLESPGGDAHAAYRIFLDLRHRCRRLRCVIPDFAKSAATMLALGMDEIYMAPSAELGPLDAQIEHPDREGVTVSALDVSKALSFLGDFAIDYISKGGHSLLQSTGLTRLDVLREFSRFASRFLEPVITKLDPHLVHKAVKQLAIAHHYSRKMLDLRRLSPEDQRRKCDARELVTNLVEHYPAHESVISRDEARDLPLPVRDAATYDLWGQTCGLHRMYHEGELSTDEAISFIRVLNPSDIDTILNIDDGSENDDAPGNPEGQTNGGWHVQRTTHPVQPESGESPQVPATDGEQQKGESV